MRMIMNRLLTSAVVASAFLVPLVASSPSRACSAPVCDLSQIELPHRGTVIPANAPALYASGWKWTEFKNLELIPSNDAGAPPSTTFAPGGMYVPTALLRINAPLVPGETYVLRSTAVCGHMQDVSGLTETTIVASEPRPLPTTVGTARVEYRLARLQESTLFPEAGQTSSNSIAAVAQITIEPSAELVPYIPLATISTSVDGRLWGSSDIGQGVDPKEPRPDVVSVPDFTRVYVACGPLPTNTCGALVATRGHHEVEISARITGSTAEIAPIKLSIDLVCPDGDAGSDASPGDGSPAPDPDAQSDSAPDAPHSDGGPATHPDASDPSDDIDGPDSNNAPDAQGPGGGPGGGAGDGAMEDGGCSVSRRTSHSEMGAGMIVLFVAAAARLCARSARRRTAA
jgi:hypothetical protein